ncbi:MAG: ComEA family DNA-binding protein [Planctomycetaceae bacterium]
MSDPQPIAPIEPTAPALAASVESATTSGIESATPAVAPVPGASAQSVSVGPLEQLVQVQSVPETWLWLTKYDQFFVGVFAAVFLMLCGYHWATLGGWGLRPIELERLPARQYDFRIDINSASWVEWTQIEGIGQVTAQAIIDDSKANGPFRSVEDLLRVKGIGPKTLEKLRPFLREPSEPDATTKSNP